jgi:hypothetical protein
VSSIITQQRDHILLLQQQLQQQAVDSHAREQTHLQKEQEVTARVKELELNEQRAAAGE